MLRGVHKSDGVGRPGVVAVLLGVWVGTGALGGGVVSPRPTRSSHPKAIKSARDHRVLKADAAKAAESFVRCPPLSLHVMDPNFTRAFHARSLETGKEGVVLVGDPVKGERS